MSRFYARPGLFTFPQNHTLCTQDTSYSPEDASNVNCVYKHLLTIKKKKKPTSNKQSDRESDRKGMKWWWYLKKTKKLSSRLCCSIMIFQGPMEKEDILIITGWLRVLAQFLWRTCVIWPEKLKIIAHVWIPLKPPIKTFTEARVTINPPSPSLLFFFFLKMISKESSLYCYHGTREQSPLLSSLLLPVLWKTKHWITLLPHCVASD